MTIAPHIYLAASGMITAVGSTAMQTAAAVQAGVDRIENTYLLNKRLRPIKMARVPDAALDPAPQLEITGLPPRQTRMLRLAAAALTDLRGQGIGLDSLPLFLALPEDLPGKPGRLRGNFIQQLGELCAVAFDSASRSVSLGRAGGLHTLDLAHKYLAATDRDHVLVGGVDTYYDADLLSRLDAEDRLCLEGALDGFIPGEGAVFLLLANPALKGNIPDPAVAVSVPGFGSEDGHYYSDLPELGAGLSSAVAGALANGSSGPVAELWTTLNGQEFGRKELGVAMTRNSTALGPDTRREHPADCLGDTGAASGLVMLAIIQQASLRHKRRESALICCSSDLAARAAVRVDVG